MIRTFGLVSSDIILIFQVIRSDSINKTSDSDMFVTPYNIHLSIFYILDRIQISFRVRFIFYDHV